MPWWAFWTLAIWMLGLPYFTKAALLAMIQLHPETAGTPVAVKAVALGIGCIWPYIFIMGVWQAVTKE